MHLEPDSPQHLQNYGECQLKNLSSDSTEQSLLHPSGCSVTFKEVSPDRLLVVPDKNIPIEPFLFDRFRYDEGAEEILKHNISSMLSRFANPQDLSEASFKPKTSDYAIDLSAQEKVQATCSLCNRIDLILKQDVTVRQQSVLQRFSRELKSFYESDYGQQMRSYIEADVTEEIQSENLYDTFIHYVSVETLALAFKKASALPRFDLDDPRAAEQALNDLKSFESVIPTLFHPVFSARVANAIHAAGTEIKEKDSFPESRNGGFFFSNDDFID